MKNKWIHSTDGCLVEFIISFTQKVLRSTLLNGGAWRLRLRQCLWTQQNNLARSGGESQDFILELSLRCVALPDAREPSVMPPCRGRKSQQEETECMNARWMIFDMCFTLSFDLNANINRSFLLEKGLQMKVYLYWHSLHNIVLSPRRTQIMILSMCGQVLSRSWIQAISPQHSVKGWLMSVSER